MIRVTSIYYTEDFLPAYRRILCKPNHYAKYVATEELKRN